MTGVSNKAKSMPVLSFLDERPQFVGVDMRRRTLHRKGHNSGISLRHLEKHGITFFGCRTVMYNRMTYAAELQDCYAL
jgi:hypothetical protein